MRPFAANVALFCVPTACAQEPNPEQLFRDAQQAQQSGNNELAVQKHPQLLTSHPEVLAAAPSWARPSPHWPATMKLSINTVLHSNRFLATLNCG
jgi:hypothetical protein